jgi:hypothetical protein
MDTMDTKLNRPVQNCAAGNTNPEQLSLPRDWIVAEAIQISTGSVASIMGELHSFIRPMVAPTRTSHAEFTLNRSRAINDDEVRADESNRNTNRGHRQYPAWQCQLS